MPLPVICSPSVLSWLADRFSKCVQTIVCYETRAPSPDVVIVTEHQNNNCIIYLSIRCLPQIEVGWQPALQSISRTYGLWHVERRVNWVLFNPLCCQARLLWDGLLISFPPLCLHQESLFPTPCTTPDHTSVVEQKIAKTELKLMNLLTLAFTIAAATINQFVTYMSAFVASCQSLWPITVSLTIQTTDRSTYIFRPPSAILHYTNTSDRSILFI